MATRKDIDKEIMFNKIMPSSLKNGGKPAETALPTPIEADTPAETTPPPKAAIFANSVQFKEKKPVVLVNTMEKLVAEKLDAAFEKFNCCKCDRCRMDVAAIALNKLTPQYKVLEQDIGFDIISAQTKAEVSTAVVQAMLLVRSHPRH